MSNTKNKLTKSNKRKVSKAEAERKKADKKSEIAAKADQLNCSKGYAAILLTIETLEAKADKSQHDYVRLANARLKVESKTISQVYKTLRNAHRADQDASENAKALRSDIIGILGRSAFPSFSEYCTPVKGKDKLFNVYTGLMLLKPFNKAAKQKARAKRQDAKLAKAA